MVFLNWTNTNDIYQATKFGASGPEGFVLYLANPGITGGVWNSLSAVTNGTNTEFVKAENDDNKPYIAGYLMPKLCSPDYVTRLRLYAVNSSSVTTNNTEIMHNIMHGNNKIHVYIRPTEPNLAIDRVRIFPANTDGEHPINEGADYLFYTASTDVPSCCITRYTTSGTIEGNFIFRNIGFLASSEYQRKMVFLSDTMHVLTATSNSATIVYNFNTSTNAPTAGTTLAAGTMGESIWIVRYNNDTKARYTRIRLSTEIGTSGSFFSNGFYSYRVPYGITRNSSHLYISTYNKFPSSGTKYVDIYDSYNVRMASDIGPVKSIQVLNNSDNIFLLKYEAGNTVSGTLDFIESRQITGTSNDITENDQRAIIHANGNVFMAISTKASLNVYTGSSENTDTPPIITPTNPYTILNTNSSYIYGLVIRYDNSSLYPNRYYKISAFSSDVNITDISYSSNALYILGYTNNNQLLLESKDTTDSNNVITLFTDKNLNTNKMGYYAFLIKINETTGYQWTSYIGSITEDPEIVSSSIVINNSDNIYVSGKYKTSSVHPYNSRNEAVGRYDLNNTDNTTYDVFVVEYDANGNMMWHTHAGSSSSDSTNFITTDNTSVYIGGSYTDEFNVYNNKGITFAGNLEATGTVPDIFYIKFTPTTNTNYFPLSTMGNATTPAKYRTSFPDTNTNTNNTQYSYFRFTYLTSNNTWQVNSYLDLNQAMDVPVVCFIGESLVKVKEIETGDISYLQVNQIFPEKYLIYNILTNDYVKINYNFISGTKTKVIKIRKNLFSDNAPFDDFYVTHKHPILLDNIETVAEKIPGAEIVSIDNQPVYSFVTEERIPLDINGIAVMSWGITDFNSFIKKNNTNIWYDISQKQIIPLLE